MRRILKSLVTWLDERKVACVLITHVNKAVGKGLDAVERIIGSVAWGSSARITVAFAKDPNTPGQLLCGGTKNNLGDILHPLAYRIAKTDALATIEWVGKSDASMEEAMNQTPKKSRGRNAVEWLIGIFREKREWESDEIRRMAKEVGVSKYALFESPEVLGLPILKRKRTNAKGEQYWIWIAEDGWPKAETESSESSESCDVKPISERHMRDPDFKESRDEVLRIFGKSSGPSGGQDSEDSESPDV